MALWKGGKARRGSKWITQGIRISSKWKRVLHAIAKTITDKVLICTKIYITTFSNRLSLGPKIANGRLITMVFGTF